MTTPTSPKGRPLEDVRGQLEEGLDRDVLDELVAAVLVKVRLRHPVGVGEVLPSWLDPLLEDIQQLG